ncbi:MAG: glycosyltransferase family 39 protein [Actinomycetes bacterium]
MLAHYALLERLHRRSLQWGLQAAILLVGGYLRLAHLSRPSTFIFDELYYVKGAQQFLKYGVEADGGQAVFIVHPPIGKWVIALGIQLFGDTPFGWRIAVAFLGILSILLVGRIAYWLFRSESAATIASLLYAVDALAFVHSRTSLLDSVLVFWLILAFYLMVRPTKNVNLNYALVFAVLGLATATKWSGGYFVAAFIAWMLISSFRAGADLKIIGTRLTLPFISIAVYILSWWGWFASKIGYDRNWSDSTSFIGTLRSFIHYHAEMIHFHVRLHTPHPYMAEAWSWLLLKRPTAFYYSTPTTPAGTCNSGTCSDAILAIGTPVLWWGAIAAILYALYRFLIKQDERVAPLLLALAAGIVPWLFVGQRTIFFFYAIALAPWLVLLVVYAIMRSRNHPLGQILSAFFLLAVVVNFLYFLPILDAQPLPYDQWHARMWLGSWI